MIPELRAQAARIRRALNIASLERLPWKREAAFLRAMEESGITRPMIVKVQMPLATTEQEPFALIYSQDRSVLLHVPLSKVLIAKMNGSAKRYFNASLGTPGSNAAGAQIAADAARVLDLGDEVPEQAW